MIILVPRVKRNVSDSRSMVHNKPITRVSSQLVSRSYMNSSGKRVTMVRKISSNNKVQVQISGITLDNKMYNVNCVVFSLDGRIISNKKSTMCVDKFNKLLYSNNSVGLMNNSVTTGNTKLSKVKNKISGIITKESIVKKKVMKKKVMKKKVMKKVMKKKVMKKKVMKKKVMKKGFFEGLFS
jgi:hypothetical protein